MIEQARTDMTQTRLLETSVCLFGRFGFEGASTRDIARASVTAMSTITYHFGSKEGLYLAAADHIAAQIRKRTKPLLDRANPAAVVDQQTAIELFLMVLDGIAEMMLSPETEHWALYIIREEQAPTEAFDRLYEGAMQRVAETLIHLTGVARPDLDERRRRVTAVMLFGQALILRSGRAAVCRVLDTINLDDIDRRLLRERLRANALCVLSTFEHRLT